jgi:mevalonate kinase
MNSDDFGFGKIILLGEHFVVYGFPALVAALNLKTYAQIHENSFNKLVFIDNRPKVPGFVPSKKTEFNQLLENVLNSLSLKQRNLTVTFLGSLPVTCGGIGSSAAVATAFARAVSSKFNLELSDDQINQAAFAGEKAIHGTPSGVDNTASVFGGVIKFCKQKIFSKINIKKSIEIVIVDSGKKTDTKQVVSQVRDFINKNTGTKKVIFEQYATIFPVALKALQEGDIKLLGQCMNENHKLLQALGVSCPELDEIVKYARLLGAFGAKLTGTGMGGLCILLTPGCELQKKISEYFIKSGYFVIKTRINM